MLTSDQEAAVRLARRIAEGNVPLDIHPDLHAIMKVYLRQADASAEDSHDEFRRKFSKLFNVRD